MPANNDELICTVLPPGKAFFDDLADELLQLQTRGMHIGTMAESQRKTPRQLAPRCITEGDRVGQHPSPIWRWMPKT